MCSFIENGKTYRNYICFAAINDSDNATVIIEKEKQHYPIEEIFEYFEELKKAGVKIKDYRIVDTEIHVNYLTGLKSVERKYVFMTIRYLWEGLNKERDLFYIIHDHFMRMCKIYPNLDRGLILCVAHDLFLIDRPYTNTNHTLCYNNIRVMDSLTIQEALLSSTDNVINNVFRTYIVGGYQSGYNYTDWKVGEKIPYSIEERDAFNTKEHYDNVLRFYKIIE